MSLERLKRIIKEKENIRLEFKEAKIGLPKSLFESICAMLNREGGDIVLGVNDNNEVVGLNQDNIDAMVKDLVNQSNNPQKLEPPFILFPIVLSLAGKWLIHIQIPVSSTLHKTAGVVYDRSHDGDFKVTHPHQIAKIYNQKSNYFTEAAIYRGLRFEDFNLSLFAKIRNLIRNNNPEHPWLALNDVQMLEIAGLWKRDFQSGEEGYTLAAALLFGKDEVIRSIVPSYKIDALVRINNVDRYDDREYIQTNLIDAYDSLMAFIAKHLPDKFYMEGDQRVSLRTKIFREIVANMIVHREYMNALPCTFTIFNNNLEVINANNPHGAGPIDPKNFAPFTKNPIIAKFFIQLGRVDELGSGVLNVNRLIKLYSKIGNVEFIEGAPFKTIISIDNLENEEVNERNTTDNFGTENGTENGTIIGTVFNNTSSTTKAKLTQLLNIIIGQEGKRSNDYIKLINVPERSVKRYLKLLQDADLIEFRRYSSKISGYYLSNKIRKFQIQATENELDIINRILNSYDFKDREKSRLIAILHFIKTNNETKVLDLANHLKVSARTIKNDLKTLVAIGAIKYVGSKKSGSYMANFV